MKSSTAPFLMFTGHAEEALNFYISLIPDSRLLEIKRYGEQGQGIPGKVMVARASLGGLVVMASDTPITHKSSFTPSISLFHTCASEADLDALAARLSEGGMFLMPPGSYGFSRKFAWVQDKYGVSWQLNLSELVRSRLN